MRNAMVSDRCECWIRFHSRPPDGKGLRGLSHAVLGWSVLTTLSGAFAGNTPLPPFLIRARSKAICAY
jgi:hypothetical protein